jgi:putative multicomponent Na+:H+ antiporter subunit B
MNDIYVYAIVALLPVSASMVVFQVNPYNALVIRGILGAVAALVYAVLGAADVALTEALVGTMLAITLYAVAVRSSMVMRLGILKDESNETNGERHFGQLLDDLRTILGKRHMRLELVSYKDPQDLQQALMDKEVHATCAPPQECDRAIPDAQKQPDRIVTRVRRIYDIMQTELSSPANLIYLSTPDAGEKHS